MTTSFTIALAQINPTVGQLANNTAAILTAYWQAEKQGADLVLSSEMVLPGYPPEDLILKPAFQNQIENNVNQIVTATKAGKAGLILGTSWRLDGGLYNALLLIEGGQIQAVRCKHHLPNYGVFDEQRLFQAGPLPDPVAFRGGKLGIMVCEDIWFADVAGHLRQQGAEIFLTAHGSPFEFDKTDQRLGHCRARCQETGIPLIYVNQLGGQDELVFDGGSFIVDANGQPVGQLANFTPQIGLSHWHRQADRLICSEAPQEIPLEGTAALYAAMVTGVRDYVEKNKFPGVLLGISGGIDSALSAVAAVDALGSKRVHGVMMPSPYTSPASLDDAKKLAANLDIRLDHLDITPAMQVFSTMLTPLIGEKINGVPAENIQSRARGLSLMALSNATGNMVLTTGNKSEVAVGYATLYGDMCGGYSVLKDVYKTQVTAMSQWRNTAPPETIGRFLGPEGEVIPTRIITRPPTAELRPDQKDEDSLPPYAILDDILTCMIEEEMSVAQIEQRGHNRQIILKIWNLLDRNEYKRRQAAPGVKLTRRAFGRDRRYPITNGFHQLLKS